MVYNSCGCSLILSHLLHVSLPRPTATQMTSLYLFSPFYTYYNYFYVLLYYLLLLLIINVFPFLKLLSKYRRRLLVHFNNPLRPPI